ncbi:MAG: isoprenylcysteine carboxylmethyltransferase family protein [bacterium]
MVVKAVLFFGIGILLWHPLPVHPQSWLRAALLPPGAVLLFGGIALYLWGLRSLRRMFGPASGFGVRLHEGHRLVTEGPYRYLRHPMYVGIMSAGFGSLLLYRMWATLCLAVAVLALAKRGRREEKILGQEFGSEWETYRGRVPAWIPRFGVKKGNGA